MNTCRLFAYGLSNATTRARSADRRCRVVAIVFAMTTYGLLAATGFGQTMGPTPVGTPALTPARIMLQQMQSQGRTVDRGPTTGEANAPPESPTRPAQPSSPPPSLVAPDSVAIAGPPFFGAPQTEAALTPAQQEHRRTMLADAMLRDIDFVDDQTGWIVGDRGLILHTRDGGTTWKPQNSRVGCTLHDVFFLNRRVGWIVGGGVTPGIHTGEGVVLATQDGGQTWQPSPQLGLPLLRAIHFIDHRRGFAAGCASELFASGILYTEDGGRTWRGMSNQAGRPWRCAAFSSDARGAFGADNGLLYRSHGETLQSSATPRFGLAAANAAELIPPNFGWLAGEGGLLMMTRDSGRTWQTPASFHRDAGVVPPQMAWFDLHDVATQGADVWIVGAPGSCVFHSPDAGRHWQVQSTGSPLPLHAIEFVDDERGWAAGALGTVLATQDGGATWQVQRSGGKRLALLGLFRSHEDIPLPIFAKYCGEDGYLGGVSVLGRRDLETESGEEVAVRTRLHETLVEVGGSVSHRAWRFPLRQQGLPVSYEDALALLDRANDGQGRAKLLEHLVLQIRQWQPEVVVTYDADAGDGATRLIREAVGQAVRKAADPMSYPDQISQGNLAPWQTPRTVAVLSPGAIGEIVVKTEEMLPRTGMTIADAVLSAQSLLTPTTSGHHQPPRKTICLHAIEDHVASSGAQRDLLAGIALMPGDARRRCAMIDPGDPSLVAVARRRRNVRAIIEQTIDQKAASALAAQTTDLLDGLPPDAAAHTLSQLARSQHANGRFVEAASAYSELTARYPTHPLAYEAFLWLVQYYASSEAQSRLTIGDGTLIRQVTSIENGDHGSDRPKVVRASAEQFAEQERDSRAEMASMIAKAAQKRLARLAADPRLQFPLAVAERERGFPAPAERFYLLRSRRTPADAWARCAAGEQWLAQPQGECPKPIHWVGRAPAKPYLDGCLDEMLWEHASWSPLRSTQGDDVTWPASFAMAYDDDFLYLAVRCRFAPQFEYPPNSRPAPTKSSDDSEHDGTTGVPSNEGTSASEGPQRRSLTEDLPARTRDADLAGSDRIELYLDLDRDYATYYRMAVDHQGRTSEACWGDTTWNPKWYVAVGIESSKPSETGQAGSDSDPSSGINDNWIIEAAIPLVQLMRSPPSPRTTWAIGLQRIVPSVGFQSWSYPAAVAVRPEGFGYLIFQ